MKWKYIFNTFSCLRRNLHIRDSKFFTHLSRCVIINNAVMGKINFVSNEYNSRVAEGLERLETNYFVKLVYTWK